LKLNLSPEIAEMAFTLRLLIHNKLALFGIAILAPATIMVMFAPYIAPHDPLRSDLPNLLLPPSIDHPFGTDQFGRDVLSRVISGARVSIFVGIIVVSIGASVGVTVGVLAGYFGGRIDELITRISDVFLAFPSLVLAMAIAGALGPSLENTMVAMAIVWWPMYTRLARGASLSVKENEYIEAERSIGKSAFGIVFSHILPNIISPIIVQATLDLGNAILTAAALSFIGMGVQPPHAEWGSMINAGREYITTKWWVATFPGFTLLLTVMGFNLLGDAIRDALDPRLRI